MTFFPHRSTAGDEGIAAFVTQVGFGRLQILPVRGSFYPSWLHRYQSMTAAAAGLRQQALNDLLGLRVAALPILVMPNATLGINEIQSGPVLVFEGAPYHVLAVNRDWEGNADFLDSKAYVIDVLLEFELRGVHADDHKSLISVLVCPRTNVGERAPPVDTRVGPELHDYHSPVQLGH